MGPGVPVVQQVSGKARHQARDRQGEGGQRVTHVLLIEKAGTPNTGDAGGELTRAEREL